MIMTVLMNMMSRKEILKVTLFLLQNSFSRHSTYSIDMEFNELLDASEYSAVAASLVEAELQARMEQFTIPEPEFDFSTPSPDDKVLQAQRERFESTEKQTKSKPEKPKDRVLKPNASAESTSRLSPKRVSEQTVVKSKHKKLADSTRKLYNDQKPILNLIVIGHVDAGKSTLMGHFLYKIGLVDKKVMQKNERESQKIGKASFSYAWVLDETDQERERGVTIDIAQNEFETETKRVVLLDAPGHKDFIPNMISGGCRADAAILVVDSSVGEFETGFSDGGQTKEHSILVHSLGVNQIVVAVNKMENCGWSEERYEQIKEALNPFLLQTGFQSIHFIPISGLKGDNLVKVKKDWYSGPSLMNLIDSFSVKERDIESSPLFVIHDIFPSGKNQIAVSGKVERGTIVEGKKLFVLPSQRNVTVKKIEDMKNKRCLNAFCGDTCTLFITGIELVNVHAGNIISHDTFSTCSEFEAKICVFDVQIPLTKGFNVLLHYLGTECSAHISALLEEVDVSGKVIKANPRLLSKNSQGVVRIAVKSPICIGVYSDLNVLGRILLRHKGKTLASGRVTKLLQ